MSGIERVVVIHDFSQPEGGAGVLAMESIRQYLSMGLAVTLITGEDTTPELEALGVSVAGVNAKPLLEVSAVEALRQGYHNSQAEVLMRNWISENDTPQTVYHLHNWSQMLSPSIFRPLQTVAERCIITCHDFFNVCPNGAFMHFPSFSPCDLAPGSMACFKSQCDRRSRLHKIWRFGRQRHLEKLAAFGDHPYTFTFIHDGMKDRFLRGGFAGKDCITIPNPVRAWSESRIEAERNAGFLFVGRVTSDKGADLALSATTDTKQMLTVIGDGELARSGAKFYPKATFVGWKQPTEIAEIAKTARALIVPSRVSEPFGLVILEAAMSGLPVIVTKNAYLADDVERLGFGQPFDPADAVSLRSAITEFAADDDKIAEMSKAGYKSANTLCHTPESWANGFVDVFTRKLKTLELA